MKRICSLLLALVLMIGLVGCDFYSDDYIRVTLDSPDETGLISYEASFSFEANAARLLHLRYHFDSIDSSEISVTFPQQIVNDDGTTYPILEFGGATGTNAPLRLFSLSIHIANGSMPTDQLQITVNAGALPIETSCWSDVSIIFDETDEECSIDCDNVKFSTDEPLEYHINQYYNDEWYIPKSVTNETIPVWHIGGEKVTIRLNHPDADTVRTLRIHNTVQQPVAVYDDYIEYEFIMPYRDISIYVEDKPLEGTTL